MRSLRLDMRAHRRAMEVALALWLVLWAVTVVTWIYDERGYSAGMNPVCFFIQLILPLVVGMVAGYWRGGARAGLAAGTLAGLLATLINYGALLLWSGLLIALGKVSPEYTPAFPGEPLFEALEMGIAYHAVGLVLGAIGGLLGGTAAGWLGPRRGRREGPNPALRG